ncbi:MAG: MBL fold metallo-hydrolase [Bacilli bacterium]
MKICSLASGSKGNTTYIATDKTNILIDLGVSCLYTEKKLKEIDVNPKDIIGILITHTHIDHISGLKVFIKKYNPTIYLTKKMHQEISKIIKIDKYQYIEKRFTVGNLTVDVIKTSHDVSDSNGYIINNNDKSIVYITDTGYINRKYHSIMKNRQVYIMESNHDINMLMNGTYPYAIKHRISGFEGHLSNKECSDYLKKLVGDKTTTIILAHLSDENNNYDLALNTTKEALKNNHIKKIIIAKQKEKTEVIQI